MPAFSGLWDGVHGDTYASTQDPSPPMTGMLRVLLQKRGMYGFVRGFGLNAPATVKGVPAARGSVVMNGGYDYANRQQDAGNQVTVTNLDASVPTLVDRPMPGDATAQEMLRVADTVLNREYAADAAELPTTAEALAEVRDT